MTEVYEEEKASMAKEKQGGQESNDIAGPSFYNLR